MMIVVVVSGCRRFDELMINFVDSLAFIYPMNV